MSEVWSLDPRSGERVSLVAEDTAPHAVDIAAEVAEVAGQELAALGRPARAALLRGVADALDQRQDKLVEIADRETALGPERLIGELGRTTAQLRLFADYVEDGGYQEAIVTPARPELSPPVPELRRLLVPLGPVVVFGASNFPFAFSVLGGDTASALAAGCSVVVKCHSGHPETSMLTLEAWQQACTELGAPKNAVQMVFGRAAGRQLIEHPRIKAASFTGSVEVGRDLHDLALGRPDPIPFYGELAGVNPLVVTEGAVSERAEEIGLGVAASVSQNGGQFCTKPGLIFVPVGRDGDRLVSSAAQYVRQLRPAVMLTAGTRDSYSEGLAALSATPSVSTLARAEDSRQEDSDQAEGFTGVPALLEVAIEDMDQSVLRECFGPLTVIVRYRSIPEVLNALAGMEGALAAAIHSTDAESSVAAQLTRAALPKVGRIVFNGYPTGLAVTAATTHAGPWPATTNALHSSVGPTAMRRFLRPVSFQNAPLQVLPEDLRGPAPRA